MGRTRKILIILVSVLIALTLAFIWGNSIFSKDSSENISQEAYGKVQVVLDFVFGKDVITHDIFRKLAHLTEFFVLALEFNVLFLLIYGAELKITLFSLLICIVVAFIDEGIQYFTGRGSTLQDVLIDSIGAIASILIILVIITIIKIKNRNNLV